MGPVFECCGHALRARADAGSYLAELMPQAESGCPFKAVVLCCMTARFGAAPLGSTVGIQSMKRVALTLLQHIGDPSRVPPLVSAHWIMVLGYLGGASHEDYLRQIEAREG